MTNGDKLKSDFPYIEIKGQDEVFTAIQIDTTRTGTPIIVYTEWWNAEYIEPTNDNCAIRNGCLTCSLDDGDDCCRKLYEESMQESTTKNDLPIDAISRADAKKAIIKYQYSDSFCVEHNIDHSINTSMALIALSDLPSVTPQYQEEHEKLERIKEIMSHEWTPWTPNYIQRVLDGTEDKY